jgi:small conductance mechanosensitive channel
MSVVELSKRPRLVDFLLLLILTASGAAAQETEAPVEPEPITEAMAAEFDEQIQAVEQQREAVLEMERRVATADEATVSLFERRLANEQIDLVEDGVVFSQAVVAQEEAGYIVGDYRSTAADILLSNLTVAESAWDSLDGQVALPEEDLGAAEQAAHNLRVSETQGAINRVIALSADSLELLDELGSPQPQLVTSFRERLHQHVLNGSVYLDAAVDEASGLRAAADAVSDDAEVAARVNVADSNVQQIARSLERPLRELEALGEDTSAYRQQLLAATGEITPEVISFSILRELLSRWGRAIADFVSEHGVTFLFRALLFLVIVFIAFKASRIVRAVAERGVEQSHAALSELLKRMIVSVAANFVLAVGLLIALSQIGISLGPLLAGLGIAGFIVGFALQDSLGNFASGLMILFYRPYDVGDIVEVGGVTGKVQHMSLVNTTVNTFDNQRIIVPNSVIWGSTITNVTAETVRRVDMMFGISYADDIPKTEQLLEEIISAHDLVLPDPEPVVKLHELGDSSVNFIVRPWTQTENYWNVYWDITRAVKVKFDEAGISIPFPQRDVHLFTENTADATETEASDSTSAPAQTAQATP